MKSFRSLTVLAIAAAATAVVGLVRAQDQSAADNASAPTEVAPIQPAAPTNTIAPPPAQNLAAPPDLDENAIEPESPAPEKKAEEAPKPEAPPAPVRSPIAILQALDKVTAETIRFAAPVGRRVRYKSLVFTVRACETRDPDAAQPKAAAYVLVESQPAGAPGRAPPPTKQVFKGWMFAASPGLHPLEHPIYDAWLIACSASAPAA